MARVELKQAREETLKIAAEASVIKGGRLFESSLELFALARARGVLSLGLACSAVLYLRWRSGIRRVA